MSKPRESQEALWRLLIDAILVIGVFVLPWWITLLSAVVFLFYFKSYYEYIFLFGLVGLLYFNVSGNGYLFSVLPVIALVTFALCEWFKSQLLRYDA